MSQRLISTPSSFELITTPSSNPVVTPFVDFPGDLTNPVTEMAGVFFNQYVFTGALTNPVLELTGRHLASGKLFTGAFVNPVLILDGNFANKRYFIGTWTLPSVASISTDLISETSSYILISTPSSDLLKLSRQYMQGTYTLHKSFRGTFTNPVTTMAGVYIIAVKAFTGTFVNPVLTLSSLYTIPVFNFTGTLNMPQTQASGIYDFLKNFNGILTNPVLTLNGFKSGRVASGYTDLIFQNRLTQLFNHTDFNTYIDSFWPAQGSGYIAGSAPFDPTNATNGKALNSGFRSITMRSPEFENKQALAIAPLIQTYYSAKRRTHVNPLDRYQITLSWQLLHCNSVFLPTLLALLYFEEIEAVLGDDTFALVLLDDVEKIVHARREISEVTLNFEGVKLNA